MNNTVPVEKAGREGKMSEPRGKVEVIR